MAKNICLNCGHFLVCNKASEEIQQCDKYVKVHREIERKKVRYENYDKSTYER